MKVWTKLLANYGAVVIAIDAPFARRSGSAVRARLPATAGGALQAMTEAEGWLGDRSSGAVATYACYGGTRSSASWLSSREAALGWQRMAGGTVVTGNC